MRTSLLAVLLLQYLTYALFLPNSNAQIQGLIGKLAQLKKWKDVIVIQQTCCNPVSPQQLRQAFDNSVSVRLITLHEDTCKILKSSVIRSSQPVLVFLPFETLMKFLSQVSKQGLMSRYFTWWIFLEMTSLPNSISQLRATKKLEYLFSPIQVHIGSDVTIIIYHKHKGIVEFWDFYKATENDIYMKEISLWNMSSPTWSLTHKFTFLPTYMDKILLRFCDHKNISLKVGVLTNKQDYNYDCKVQTEKNTGKILLQSGYSIRILDILMDKLKIKVQVVGADTWGTFNDEGQWNGIMGLMIEELVDLALCHPSITVERSEAVQFLHSTLQSKRVLIYRASGLPLTKDALVLTFSKSLWLCLIVTIGLLAFCLHLSTSLYAKYKEDAQPWKWTDVALWVVATTCQQGSTEQPRGVSCSTVFIVGYISMYLLYTAFAAGVTSLLAVQGRDTCLQLSDVRRMHASLYAYWDGLLPEFFQTSQDATVKSLYVDQLHKGQNRVRDLGQLFAHVLTGISVGMANLHPTQNYMLTQLSSEEACQITLSAVPGTKHTKAFAVRKESPYQDIFNYWILRMHEAGLLHRAALHSMSSLAACSSSPGYSSATLANVMSSILIFAAGIAFAIVLLLAEKVWFRHQNEDHCCRRHFGHLKWHFCREGDHWKTAEMSAMQYYLDSQDHVKILMQLNL